MLCLSRIGTAERSSAMKLGNIMIFGDSYSTYMDHVPEGYAVYYADDREFPPFVGLEETWWRRLINATGANLIQNNSWSGSTIGYLGYNGDCSKTNSFIFRLNELAEQGFFENNKIDTVFVFGGTNDCWCGAPLGEIQFDNHTREDLFNVLPAICYFLKRLKELLPNAEIVSLVNTDLKPEFEETFRAASEHFGTRCICFESIDKESGHPTVQGMEDICSTILKELNL